MPGAKRKGKELYKFFSFSFIALLVPFVFLSCLDWGKKKAAILLVSWQPVIGRGTSKAAARVPEDVQDLHQRLNFVGAPEVTRHLAFGAVKESYAEDEDYVLDVLEHLMQDLHSAMVRGVFVHFHGQPICLRLAAVSCKGDWPWLCDAGALTRSFRTASKRPSAKNPPAGICHLCMAGYQGVPCSDSHPQAKWISTMHSAAAFIAWETETAVTRLMPFRPSFPAERYRPDVFHNWHLGIGKNFCASALVVLLPLCDGSSVVKKFEEMTRLWRSFCRSRRLGKHLS